MARIHPTALVDPRAEVDGDVEIGAYTVIGPGVRVGRGTRIRSHVVIEGNTSLGEGNRVFQFATVGSAPQDLKYKGEHSRLIIGNHNTIREYASVNPGTAAGGMVTQIGDRNLLMMYCHIAHDCRLGGYNIIANGANLAGHVVIDDYVVVGALVGIHQFVKIGTGALLAAGSMVSKDVVPYCSAAGDRARLRGLNLIGLRRRGVSGEKIEDLKQAYRIVFRSGLRTVEAVEKIRRDIGDSEEIRKVVAFIEASRRGICR